MEVWVLWRRLWFYGGLGLIEVWDLWRLGFYGGLRPVAGQKK